ncbi:hypothetical protein [Halobacillus litoralis]|uniref:hypothetical protein n=1 Tax=Halobacillus litoralis TaxID=45668 RepID=UPI001371C07C|nr:hypothetical protein [Halobacillus litoralis]MYL39831.1 hypothetical protein [Halobacillus litoralis]
MFNKDKVNLRRKSSRIYVTVITFVFAGLAFFLTSGFIMKEKVEVLSSPVNENIEVSSTQNIEIIKWIYDKDKNRMEIVIDTKNLDSDYENLKFTSFQRSDESELKTETIFQFEDHYVVRINGLSKEYTQVALDLIGTGYSEGDKGEEELLKTLYADHREINKEDIVEKEDSEYITYTTHLIIDNIEKSVSETKEIIEENETKINELNQRIRTLKEEKVYQTDEEKLDTDNDINSLEINIGELEKENSNLEMDLDMYQEKIEKAKQKEREKILEMTN